MLFDLHTEHGIHFLRHGRAQPLLHQAPLGLRIMHRELNGRSVQVPSDRTEEH